MLNHLSDKELFELIKNHIHSIYCPCMQCEDRRKEILLDRLKEALKGKTLVIEGDIKDIIN